MKTVHLHRLGLGIANLILVGPAMAVAIVGPNGTIAQGRNVVVAAPAPAGNDSTAPVLSNGRIDAVNRATGQLVISGKTVDLHDTRLRVIGPSGRAEAGVGALRTGMEVRFALDPTSSAPDRKIVLIYIER